MLGKMSGRHGERGNSGEKNTGEGNCGEEEYRSLRNMQVKRIVSAPHAVISTAVLSILIIIS